MVKIPSDKRITKLQKEIDYTLRSKLINPFTKRKGVLTKQRKPRIPELTISQEDYFSKLMAWIKKYDRIVFYGWDSALVNNNLENLKEAIGNANVSVIISDDEIPPSLEELAKNRKIDILNLQSKKIDKGYIIITQNGLDYPTHVAIWDSTIKADEKGTPFRSVFPVQFSTKILEGVVDLAKYHKTLEYLCK